MRVAWVTHHVPRDVGASWALPDGVGGAEMTDAAMIAMRPDGVVVDVVAPDDWERAFDADRVIVTGTDMLTDEAMLGLAEQSPIVWVHHQQSPSRARQRLFAAAAPFVTMSDLHRGVECGWSGVDSLVCPGFIDPQDRRMAEGKNGRALWAARNHPQKGRINARIWAQRNRIELDEITDAPRGDVLSAMAEASWFVFLPKGIDACPRTLIEAELAGCEIVTNDLAGRRPEGDLVEVLTAQPERFWGWL